MDNIVNIPCIGYNKVYKTGVYVSNWLKNQHKLVHEQDFRWTTKMRLSVHEIPAVRFEFRDPKWATIVSLKFSKGIE